MKRNKFVKIMAVVLVVLMLLGLVSAAVVTVLSTQARADDSTIDELKVEKDALKQKKQSWNRGKKRMRARGLSLTRR